MISMCGISRRRAEQFFQQLGRQGQRIAAGEEHIPHLGGALEVFDLRVEIDAGEGWDGIANDARAGAVAAVEAHWVVTSINTRSG